MRRGIICAGNWIIDRVKIIDTLPSRGNLANIKQEVSGNGGGAYNVAKDLAKMKVSIPLFGVGMIGDDANGKTILDDLEKHGIDSTYMQQTQQAPTSYTDVMSEEKTGDRTFFHHRGANALLDAPQLQKVQNNAKIFHLAYLLLLDRLDSPDPDFGVSAAKALKNIKEKGYQTSVDVVSEQSDRFKKVVTPCLKYIDYLIINEVESSGISGLPIRGSNESIDSENLRKTARILLEKGVQKLVVIHFPEGGYALTPQGTETFVPSFVVSQGEIKGSVGAGDAFCAGMLYALHEKIPLEKALKIANASARFNLTSPTASDGACNINEIQNFISTATLRQSVVKL